MIGLHEKLLFGRMTDALGGREMNDHVDSPLAGAGAGLNESRLGKNIVGWLMLLYGMWLVISGTCYIIYQQYSDLDAFEIYICVVRFGAGSLYLIISGRLLGTVSVPRNFAIGSAVVQITSVGYYLFECGLMFNWWILEGVLANISASVAILIMSRAQGKKQPIR